MSHLAFGTHMLGGAALHHVGFATLHHVDLATFTIRLELRFGMFLGRSLVVRLIALMLIARFMSDIAITTGVVFLADLTTGGLLVTCSHFLFLYEMVLTVWIYVTIKVPAPEPVLVEVSLI